MRVDVDPVTVQDHEGLVAGLRALKTACGKSTTLIASDAGLSTSGIEGVLAGANFPTEDTVRRFVEACGVASARPWLDARTRAAAARPKAPGMREELEAVRARNAELAERVAVLERRMEVLEVARSPAEAADRALTLRLARLLQPKLTDLPRIMGWDAPPDEATAVIAFFSRRRFRGSGSGSIGVSNPLFTSHMTPYGEVRLRMDTRLALTAPPIEPEPDPVAG